MAKRVLSVGQCMADHGSIRWVLRNEFRAEVEPADSATSALERLRRGGIDLVLVNRVFDADGESGLEFIRQLKKDEVLRAVPVMLVSNYEGPQREAEAAGALPGFGKADLGRPAMLERVREALDSGARAESGDRGDSTAAS